MWSYEFATNTEVDRAACWAALKAVHTGQATTASGDIFQLHGPFETGTELSVTPAGQETFRSVIIELHEGKAYADLTDYAGLTLAFRYTLADLPGGGTRLSHSLVIDGDNVDEAGPALGPQITADFPADLADLVALARG
jgi:hypothetical protein